MGLRTHGLKGTKIYVRWRSMMTRCYNPNVPEYKNYGGRGIKVCERWHDVALFYADVGDSPEGLTMDRIDNDGDYGPDNFRWATKKEQAINRRNTKYITANGSTHTVDEWSEITGIARITIWGRLWRGWPDVEAVTVPLVRDRSLVPNKKGYRVTTKHRGSP